MQKLWDILAWRLIIIYSNDLKIFSTLTQDKVKLFCKMCNIRKYNPGDPIDLSTGGILFKGTLSKVSAEGETIAEGLLKEDTKKIGEKINLTHANDNNVSEIMQTKVL